MNDLKIKTLTLVLAGLTLLSPFYAKAEVNSSELELSPAKVEVSLNPGESKEINLTLTNKTNQIISASLSVENFLPSEDPIEVVKFTGPENSIYAGRNFIFLNQTAFSVKAGETINLPVRVSAPTLTSHGGKFAAVFVTFGSEGEGSGTNLKSRLGSLFFIRVGSDYKESGKLAKFGLLNDKRIFWNGKINFFATFINDGNVHLNPYGGITTHGLWGNGVTEIKPWFVLPGATRTRVVEGDSVGWKIGRYTATLELNRGYQDVIDTSSVSYWVISWRAISLILLVLVGVAIVVTLRRKST